mmetsp:Transcript_7303/g.8377  ORF Transcript_7303/g.8377 Transcript_7303/m.8377 type:complete len:855 (+) Transcript_7303:388-2952(+)
MERASSRAVRGDSVVLLLLVISLVFGVTSGEETKQFGVDQFSSTAEESFEDRILKFDFGIGIDSTGWFRLETLNGEVFSASNLKHVPHLFGKTKYKSLSHQSSTFHKVDGERLISLVVHSSNHASLTILDEERSLDIRPIHHLRQENARRLESVSDHVISNSSSVWEDSNCGAVYIKDGNEDTENAGVPNRKERVEDIVVEDLASSDDVEVMSPVRESKFKRCSDRCDEKCERKSNTQNHEEKQETCLEKCMSICYKTTAAKTNNQTAVHQHGTRRSLAAKAWQGCYTGQQNTHILDIGFLVDYGFFLSYGGDITRVMEAVEVILANTNLLLSFQLNLFVRARQIVIVDSPPGSMTEVANPSIADILSQNQENKACHYEIEKPLDAMLSLSQQMQVASPDNVPKIPQTYNETLGLTSNFFQAGHWHYLSNCYPANCNSSFCTIGIAFVRGSFPRSTVCSKSQRNGVAVSSRNQQTWLVFAHEMGHNFGAQHSFEEGQGKTGGIMDYEDNRYEGEYQFNEKYRRDELCSELNELVTSDRCDENGFSYLQQYTDDCATVEDYTKCLGGDVGICFNGTCIAVEPLLVVPINGTDYRDRSTSVASFALEVSESGPFSLYGDPIEGELLVGESLLCSSTTQNFTGKIAFIERSSTLCTFEAKARHAEAAGAIAIIIHNNVDGYRTAMSGSGVHIPMVQVTFADGEEILAMEERFVYIGGFPATGESNFFPVNVRSEKEIDIQKALTFSFAVVLVGCVIYLTYDVYMERKYKDSDSEDSVSLGLEDIEDDAFVDLDGYGMSGEESRPSKGKGRSEQKESITSYKSDYSLSEWDEEMPARDGQTVANLMEAVLNGDSTFSS